MTLTQIRKLTDEELVALKEKVRNEINALEFHQIKAKRDKYKLLERLNREMLWRKMKLKNERNSKKPK